MSPKNPFQRTALLLPLLLVHVARAQEVPAPDVSVTAEDSQELPPRYVLTASAGVPLRFTQNVDFDQSTTAPAFVDALAGYVFAGDGRYRHGLGLGFSLNLSEDGGFTEPVPVRDQVALMPAYLGFWDLDPDLFALGHLGVPFLAGGGESVGLELAFGLGYRMRAGAGFFAEAGLDAFVGASSTLHPSISLEAGLFIDYEVLP